MESAGGGCPELYTVLGAEVERVLSRPFVCVSALSVQHGALRQPRDVAVCHDGMSNALAKSKYHQCFLNCSGNATTLTNRKLGLLLGHFSSRIGAASITWFVNDFAFYVSCTSPAWTAAQHCPYLSCVCLSEVHVSVLRLASDVGDHTDACRFLQYRWCFAGEQTVPRSLHQDHQPHRHSYRGEPPYTRLVPVKE